MCELCFRGFAYFLDVNWLNPAWWLETDKKNKSSSIGVRSRVQRDWEKKTPEVKML